MCSGIFACRGSVGSNKNAKKDGGECRLATGEGELSPWSDGERGCEVFR